MRIFKKYLPYGNSLSGVKEHIGGRWRMTVLSMRWYIGISAVRVQHDNRNIPPVIPREAKPSRSFRAKRSPPGHSARSEAKRSGVAESIVAG
jgi:hypothetical protein